MSTKMAAERELGRHPRSAAGLARHRQRPAERLDPVDQPAQARPIRRVGAAGAVVGDVDGSRPDVDS